MSKQKKNGKNAALYKILSLVLLLALVLCGYLISGRLGQEPDVTTGGLIEDPTSEAPTGQTEPGTADEPTEPKTEATEPSSTEEEDETSPEIVVSTETEYDYYLTFYSQKLLSQHYQKHGKDMGFKSPKEYEEAANAVVQNENALHKTEKEDGDDVYYLEDTNEFVIVSTDGYIRTYFLPDDGIRYFNRQ